MTARFLITDPHGQPCGAYPGETPAEAFAAMSRAADGESLARDVSGIKIADLFSAGWTATRVDAVIRWHESHAARHARVGYEYAVRALALPRGKRGGMRYAADRNADEARWHRAEIAALTGGEP